MFCAKSDGPMKIVILGALFCSIWRSAVCLTISKNTYPLKFPKKKAITDDCFVLINKNNDFEFLTCPINFVFDNKTMKCTYNNSYTLEQFPPDDESKCPEGYRGTILNPSDCRTYFNCWDGTAFISSCSEHLIYNNDTKECDWPENESCCEFWEINSEIIVANV